MDPAIDAPRAATAARRAVAALFLLNAAAYANVAPRLPSIKDDLGLSNTALGAAVAAMPAGALLAGPAAAWLIARVGSGRLAVACGVGFGVVLPAFAVASGWPSLALTFFVLGCLDSWMDVAMNAHALRVQRLVRRSIINGLHGLWSVGAVVGGVVAAAAAGADIGLAAHLVVAGAVIVGGALAVRRRLLPGADEPSRPQSDPDGAADADARRGVGRALALLGLVVVLSAVIEDAPQSWGALLLRSEAGASAATAGAVFIAFQTAMTVGRLAGDRAVDRFGPVEVGRAGGLLVAAGVGAGLAIGTTPSIVVGFACAGLGAASLFPLAFHAAGNMPGVATGHGLTLIAWMGRIGFLAAAPLVGLLGDHADLRAALIVVPVAGAAVAAIAGVLRHAGGRSRRA